jgi:hypothetical protein
VARHEEIDAEENPVDRRLLGDTANKVWAAVELVYPIKVHDRIDNSDRVSLIVSRNP